ncbi:MAG: bifunctional diaminohydroxyphosphoribosylaminopyrimidine deaminase/5-amino-6-(5-phosphoribosylamino)uracil reductase RibD [Geminicoccaceae bacterium]|nr:bifunctional diaminohydroxyphosphoribosylaminopyrimidine deaminase/5-amino-6-(5-phosphoribosylamino)uracil reductase RibD [Geminicoccaceae bacterium]
MTAEDARFMRSALTLGERALGTAWPNPAVGCVIVRDGRIVGRGWTGAGGRPHAETVALARAGPAARGATAYVTLEPCAHHGQTPPCCDALVAAGIARAVIAMLDPDPRVDGRGVAALRAAGVAVDTGCLAHEAERAHRGFLSRLRAGRPMVTLKAATSLDGRIASATGVGRWITGERARAWAHRLRAEHDAVLVGIGTVLADDPELTCRLPGLAGRSPVRVVLDRRLRLPPDSRLARTAREVPVWVVTNAPADPERAGRLSALGVRIETTSEVGAGSLAAALALLAERGITRVLVEGGGEIATAFVRAGLVDRLVLFQAPILLGADGVPLVGGLAVARPDQAERWAPVDVHRLGEDEMRVLEPARGKGCSPAS